MSSKKLKVTIKSLYYKNNFCDKFHIIFNEQFQLLENIINNHNFFVFIFHFFFLYIFSITILIIISNNNIIHLFLYVCVSLSLIKYANYIHKLEEKLKYYNFYYK
jgi:hypothetical protein